MHDAALVEIVQAKDNLSDVVPRPLLRKGAQRLDQRRTIAAVQVLHDEVQVLLALECEVQLRHERRLRLLHEDHALSLHIRDLVLRYHVRLLQDLDREVVPGYLLFGQEDGTERALRDGLDNLEVLDGRRSRPRERRDRGQTGG